MIPSSSQTILCLVWSTFGATILASDVGESGLGLSESEEMMISWLESTYELALLQRILTRDSWKTGGHQCWSQRGPHLQSDDMYGDSKELQGDH